MGFSFSAYPAHSLAHFLVTTQGGKRYPFYREVQEAKAQAVLPPRGRLGSSVPGAPPPCWDSHLPEFRRALPGPEARAGRTRARTSADQGRRRHENRTIPGKFGRLPDTTAGWTGDGAHTSSAFPRRLRVGDKLPALRTSPRKTTLPRRLRGRASSGRPARKTAALSGGRAGGWVSSQSCSTGTRTRSIQGTTGSPSACFLSTMAPEPRNYTSQKIRRPRKVFRVAGLLTRTSSCRDVGRPCLVPAESWPLPAEGLLSYKSLGHCGQHVRVLSVRRPLAQSCRSLKCPVSGLSWQQLSAHRRHFPEMCAVASRL